MRPCGQHLSNDDCLKDYRKIVKTWFTGLMNLRILCNVMDRANEYLDQEPPRVIDFRMQVTILPCRTWVTKCILDGYGWLQVTAI